MEEYTNHENIAVLGVKLDNINETLNKIVTQTTHIEARVDKLEQGRFAVRTIAVILGFMLPFVIGGGVYMLDLHIGNIANRIIEQSLNERGL